MITNPAHNCKMCLLSETRTHVVWGEGQRPARIMLLGEAPGRIEDAEGRPFAGPSGRKLDTCLAEAGLSREELYITNVVRCRPPGNRDPMPREVEACSTWLQMELWMADPAVVVLMGRHAARLAFPHDLKKLPAGAARAMELYGRPVIALCTYHPAYALRAPLLTAAIIRDLKRAKAYQDWRHEKPPPPT